MIHPVTDKVNKVDFHWHIVRTLPHQEQMLYDLLLAEQASGKGQADNILEAYCPTHTTVRSVRQGRDVQVPLFAGYVFVLSTHRALVDFLMQRYPPGHTLYVKEKGKSHLLTIPEPQMRFFREFNENYFDQVILLERPYTDYAFNPKNNEPNDIVKVIDGPLAGCTGYLARFKGDRRLVFRVKGVAGGTDLTVAIPNVWDFHVVRLHNAEGDRQTVSTQKNRAFDLLVGLLEKLGYGEQTLPMFHDIMAFLTRKTSFVELRKALDKEHPALGKALSRLPQEQARLLLNLVRYELDNPGYIRATYQKHVIRSFLTPSLSAPGTSEADTTEVPHAHFTEIIRRVTLTESAYYPTTGSEAQVDFTYDAHIGKMTTSGVSLYFIDWEPMLKPYFLTADTANKKLLASFHDYAPTFHAVLTGDSPVKAIKNMAIGDQALDVLCVEATPSGTELDLILQTCLRICQEINTSTHLAVWRRYLYDIWLHR